MLNCTFPSCKARLEPNQAKVPAVQAIRNATGKPVVVADLAKFALCGRHSRMVEAENKKEDKNFQMFSYAGTATLLKRREVEQEAARAYSLQLRAKTQMGKAIAKALAETIPAEVPQREPSSGPASAGSVRLKSDQPQSS